MNPLELLEKQCNIKKAELIDEFKYKDKVVTAEQSHDKKVKKVKNKKKNIPLKTSKDNNKENKEEVDVKKNVKYELSSIDRMIIRREEHLHKQSQRFLNDIKIREDVNEIDD